MRLIIVCDEPLAARRLCSELSNCPADTVCVTNLEELKDACETPYELALVNIAQSELIECLRTIREAPSGPIVRYWLLQNACRVERNWLEFCPNYEQCRVYPAT